MNLRRNHIVGVLGLFTVAGGLYWAKIEGQEARVRLTALEHSILVDRRAVRTLEAELAFLERPDRLEAAATEALALEAVKSDRRVTLAELPAAVMAAHAVPSELPVAIARTDDVAKAGPGQ